MQNLAKIVAGLGLLLVVGAGALLALQGEMSPRHEIVENAIQKQADACIELETAEKEGASRRKLKRLRGACGKSNLGQLFAKLPLDLERDMPDAPAGWTRRDYQVEDGIYVLSDIVDGETLPSTAPMGLATDYAAVDDLRKMGAVAVYTNGDRMMILKMRGNSGAIREARLDRVTPFKIYAKPFALKDGLPIVVDVPWVHNKSGGSVPVPYRRFTMSLDYQVDFEILAKASDADILALFDQLDFQKIGASLKHLPARFTPGTGIDFAGTPSVDLPEASLALQAYRLFKKNGNAETPEGRALIAISEGRADDWRGAFSAGRGEFDPSPDLIALLGPVSG